jgi:hypothetical protein
VARIGVRDRPADRAPVTHLRVADMAGGVRQQRHVLVQQIGGLDVAVAGEGADRDVVACVADVRQVADTADIDQHRWLRQAQLHQRQKAVATREELGFVTVLPDEADGLFGRTGADVVECCGDHCEPPWAALPA